MNLFLHLQNVDNEHVLYNDIMRSHEIMYAKRSDFFRRKGL